MLKTDYKDDVFEGDRQYSLTQNANNTVSLRDVTTYTREGDQFGADDINATNEALNNLTDVELPALKKSVSDGKTLLAAAITAKRVAAAATDTFAQLAAKIGQIILGSGNAMAADVLAGKTFTNSTGVEQTGTMVDASGATSAATASLDATNSRLQLTIPTTGKYSTGSRLYAAYSTIASLIGLTAAKLIPGNTILGITSSVTSKGAATYTPGTVAQVIAAGQYLSGAQTISAVANLSAANIKKGVVVGGVTGTWDGYVATATDLYYNGANAANITLSSGLTFAATQIVATNGGSSHTLTFGVNYNITGYTKLIVEGNIIWYNYANSYLRSATPTSLGNLYGSGYPSSGNSSGSITFDISQYTGIASGSTDLYFSLGTGSYINRIRIA